MSRINTNVESLIAQRVLGQNNGALSLSLERLSTGLKINRGADDPAGLIASENLRAEKTALGAAISNAERAEQVVNIAEGGLQEISGLLTELEGLLTTTANTAGLSAEEREANQLQIDSILQTINRLAQSTSFQGRRLLNGNLGYQTSNVSADVSNFKVNGAKLELGQTLDVNVLVTQSAQQGALYLSTGATLNFGGNPSNTFVIEIGGAKGSRELSFSSSTAIADIIAAINSFTDVTGVSAATQGTGIALDSTELGTDEFVSVKIINDGGIVGAGLGIFNKAASDVNTVSAATQVAFTATAAQNGITDKGQDVGATINGIVATTKGARAGITTDFLSVEVELGTGAASTANSQTLGGLTALTIKGGGADFQLASQVDIAGKVSLGVDNVSITGLGRTVANGTTFTLADLAAGKALNVEDGDLTKAQDAVRQAIKDVSSLRGRLGAFQKNTVGATIRSLGISLENTTAAESAIRDADFAAETAGLTRSQILVNSSTNVLSIANTAPQAVLQLLG